MLRQSELTDFGIFAIACFAIAVSLCPREQRQQILVKQDNEVQAYSLSVDDIRLAQLKDSMVESPWRMPPAQLAIADWHRELSEFYCQQMESQAEANPQPPPVAQVSFQQPVSSGQGTPADIEYWRETGRQANVMVNKIQQERRKQRQRVTLGDVYTDAPASTAILLAFCCSLTLAAAFIGWCRLCPPRKLGSVSIDGYEQTQLRMLLPDGEGVITVPCNCVRSTPNAMYVAHRVCLLLIVAGGALSLGHELRVFHA